MNVSQVTLFQRSFLQLMPDADKLTDLFFARLFQLDPTVRGMFPNDLRVQKGKLMRALAQLARHLESPNQSRLLMEQLGRRHARLNLNAGHYDTFGAALLWTLETGLGEDFTPELREAWRAFYDELAAVMQSIPELGTFHAPPAQQWAAV